MFKYALPASLLLSVSAFAQTHVVTSVKPVSMIVSAIGGEHVEIEQLVRNQASPHDFAMRPSDLRKLDQADLVVWVGESLETFLEKPLANLSEKKDLEWMALNGVFLRNFGDNEAHDHEDHDHEDHDHEDHDHEDHDHEDHDHEDHDHEDHDHDGHHHSGTDPHVWLDPVNAEVLAKAVTERLVEIDPEHKQDYQANYKAFMNRVENADHEAAKQLTTVAEVPYFVFHEAYGYFENHYGMNNKGAIAVSPERKPGAKTVAHIRESIEEHNVSCVFSEPQFSPAIVGTLIEGTSVKTAVLDPLGTNIELDADSYARFLTGLADQYISCLK